MGNKNNIGTEENPYKISCSNDLGLLNEHPESHFKVTEDIEMTEDTVITKEVGPMGEKTERKYVAKAFSGVLDGKNHKIKNATCQLAKKNKGDIKNLRMRTDIDGKNSLVGGLAGINDGQIRKCSVSGSIKGNKSIGGIVGECKGGIKDKSGGAIYDCSFCGELEGKDHLGGIAGVNEGKIKDCRVGGNVSGRHDSISPNIGGIAGLNRHEGAIITNCFFYGEVDGSTHVGGIVGGNREVVERSIANAEVTGEEGVGMLAGINAGRIDNCHFVPKQQKIGESVQPRPKSSIEREIKDCNVWETLGEAKKSKIANEI